MKYIWALSYFHQADVCCRCEWYDYRYFNYYDYNSFIMDDII